MRKKNLLFFTTLFSISLITNSLAENVEVLNVNEAQLNNYIKKKHRSVSSVTFNNRQSYQIKKIYNKKVIRQEIKNKDLISSLVIYQNYVKNFGHDIYIDNMILNKARKIRNLDYPFFERDFLSANSKKLKKMIKELKHELY